MNHSVYGDSLDLLILTLHKTVYTYYLITFLGQFREKKREEHGQVSSAVLRVPIVSAGPGIGLKILAPATALN